MDNTVSLLIIDKDKEHLKSLLEYIHTTEIEAYTLNSIEELFDKAIELVPNAILCDHKNSDTELAQALMKFKAEEITKNIPFFVLGRKIPKPLANQFAIRGAEVVSQDTTPIELLSHIFPEYFATLASGTESGTLEEVNGSIDSQPYMELKVSSDSWDLLRTWSKNEMHRIEGHILIVNLLECDFVNSEGIGTLITLLHECRNFKVHFYIMSADSHFKDTIKQTGLLEIFNIVVDHKEFKQALTHTRENK